MTEQEADDPADQHAADTDGESEEHVAEDTEPAEESESSAEDSSPDGAESAGDAGGHDESERDAADHGESADDGTTEVDTLRADVEEYQERVDELESKLKRKQADFENYKKRMKRRQEEEKARATEDLVERLLDVRDNLSRALEQDADTDIRDGIETTLKQFDRVLDEENVTAIEPEPGDEVDPQRHEVLVRMDSEQPDGTIAQVHRPGYEMAEKVIRPAQVAVSEE